MIRFSFLILCFLSTTCALKVMNFDMFGHHGIYDDLRKIADQIKAVNPEIVTMQDDINRLVNYTKLIKLMGNGWSLVEHCRYARISIMTRHEIAGMYEHIGKGFNVRIQLRESGKEISVWSLNLYGLGYGPNEAEKGNKTTLEQILSSQKKRIDSTLELLKHPKFVQQIKNAANVPVIVAGNFYTPSHLDWIETTKNRTFGWVVEWPVTKLLSNAAGLSDSFREVHTDPLKTPGFTIDQVITPEIHNNRIHFIFYRGSLKPISSYTYAGTTPIAPYGTPDFPKNEWPSFRRAVITEFEFAPHKNENKFSVFLGSEYSDRHFELIGKCPMKIIEYTHV